MASLFVILLVCTAQRAVLETTPGVTLVPAYDLARGGKYGHVHLRLF